MHRFNKENIRIVLMVVAVFFLYGFSNTRNVNREISSPKITFVDKEELFFLNQEVVNKLLIQNNHSGFILSKDKVALKSIEDFLDSHENIEKAEVFLTIDGFLQVEIKQKKPLVRVIENDFSYYIDTNGGFIPMSERYTSRVPLVVGVVPEDDLKREPYVALFQYMQKDSFLKKNIVGIEIDSIGELVMKSRNYTYDIYFGKPKNVVDKFKNYKAFFNKAVADSTILTYQTINLKYARQVVCAQ